MKMQEPHLTDDEIKKGARWDMNRYMFLTAIVLLLTIAISFPPVIASFEVALKLYLAVWVVWSSVLFGATWLTSGTKDAKEDYDLMRWRCLVQTLWPPTWKNRRLCASFGLRYPPMLVGYIGYGLWCVICWLGEQTLIACLYIVDLLCSLLLKDDDPEQAQ